MIHRPPSALAAVLFTLALAPAAAVAEVDIERIQARLDTAKRLFDSELPGDALQVLEEVAAELGADGEAGFPVLRFMMARCLMALDRPDEALAALARFEALARDDAEKALAAEWIAKVRARHFGGLTVDCPEGATARIEAEGAPAPQPCPAAFEAVRVGRYTVRVEGAGPDRAGEVEVAAGEVRAVSPAPVPEDDGRWIWAGVALTGGAGLLGGAVPEFVEPGAGASASAEVFGDLALFGDFALRVGFGYGFQQIAYTDDPLDADGYWQRHALAVPVEVRMALPWNLGVTLGGGLDIFLDGHEVLDGDEADVGARFAELGGFARGSVDYGVFAGPLDVRLALRYQRWITPLFSEADPVIQSVELGLHLVL